MIFIMDGTKLCLSLVCILCFFFLSDAQLLLRSQTATVESFISLKEILEIFFFSLNNKLAFLTFVGASRNSSHD